MMPSRFPSLASTSFRSLATALVIVAAVSAPALAQKQEPTPPGAEGDDAEAPPTRATPRARTSSGANLSVTDARYSEARATTKVDPLDWRHAIGVYARYIFVTELMLKPYLDTSTSLNSFAVGLQYHRRYDKFDVVTTLDFSWMALGDGNWLGKGNDPALDTKYVQFDKLSFLSADVAIIGHHAFNNWLEIRGGAGLGLGVVFGDVLTTSNSNQVCNKDNAGDTSKCYPISPTVGPIYLNQPDTEQKLKATEDSSRTDTAQNPHRKPGNKPPVMAVLNIMLGLNFRLHKHVSAQVELGFRDAVYTGAGVQYHF
jgi:hypothetical protein